VERRDFIKACAVSCALGARDVLAAEDLRPRLYSRARLVDQQGRFLRAADLVAGRNYIFHYPFEATPCFLLDLGEPTGRDVSLKTEAGAAYRWPGGVGPNRSIVGFAAICTHRLNYPTPQVTFISYRDKASASQTARANRIHCCSEHSEYDPVSGARVVSGPAPQPLSAVLLEYEPRSDGLTAVGTLGGEIYDAFFAKFELKLMLERGGDAGRRPVEGRAVVRDLRNFCKQQALC
jgi:Rieske Fe-S protein